MIRLITFINDKYDTLPNVDDRYAKFAADSGLSKRTVYAMVKSNDHMIYDAGDHYKLIKVKKEFLV